MYVNYYVIKNFEQLRTLRTYCSCQFLELIIVTENMKFWIKLYHVYLDIDESREGVDFNSCIQDTDH